MYERFYGFRERPFDLTPNPRYLFLTASHREALSTLEYGLSSGKGLTLLVGQAGTGKTTLIRAALDHLRLPEHRFVHVNNPTLTRGEFYELLAQAFGLSQEAGESKAQFLIECEASIADRRAGGGRTALVIDEAQSLPADLLEEVRLLANLETNDEKLLPLVLAGQPELAERLEAGEWEQLKQRVALRCELSPLDIRDTAAYIAGRIRIAGGDVTQVFTRDAVATIHQHSRGIPRLISVICDNALVTGFAAESRPITRQIVLEVCREFRLVDEQAGPSEEVARQAPLAEPALQGRGPAAVQPPQAMAVGERIRPAAPVGTAALPGAGRQLAPATERPSDSPMTPRPPSTARQARGPHAVPDRQRPAPPPGNVRQVDPSRPAASPHPVDAARSESGTGADRDTLFGHFNRKRRFRFF